MRSPPRGLLLLAVFVGLLTWGGCGAGSSPSCLDPAYASECSSISQFGGGTGTSGGGNTDGGSVLNDGGPGENGDGGIDAGSGAMDAGVFDAGL